MVEILDTDQIMPSRYLNVATFLGIERHVSADGRLAAAKRGEPHPMDRVSPHESRILVVNRNFGCGSSREYAPQGLARSGIVAILGESFGEIFAGNCVAVGMPCVQLGSSAIVSLQRHIETNPKASIMLSLAGNTIAVDSLGEFPIMISAGRLQQFLSGTSDSMTTLLDAGNAIESTLGRLPHNSYFGCVVVQPRAGG